MPARKLVRRGPKRTLDQARATAEAPAAAFRQEFPEDFLPEEATEPTEEPESGFEEETETETNPDPGESNRERFQRLIGPRLNRCLSALRVLGNCGSRGSYEYREGEVDQVFFVLQRALDEAKESFSDKGGKEEVVIVFED